MPGKHAPASPRSFYLSVARAVAGGLTAIALLVVIVMVAAGSGDDPGTPAAIRSTFSPSPTPTSSLPDLPTETPSPAPSVGETPTAAAVRPPSRVTVVVLNGTDRQGLAARVATQLEEAGYDVLRPGNAGFSAVTSSIYYKPGFRDEAEAMRRRFPDLGRARAVTARTSSDANITVVVGADYPD